MFCGLYCMDCIVLLCEIYVDSKYFLNQQISQDSRDSGEFLYDKIFRIFFNLDKSWKNSRHYQNWQILTNEIAN